MLGLVSFDTRAVNGCAICNCLPDSGGSVLAARDLEFRGHDICREHCEEVWNCRSLLALIILFLFGRYESPALTATNTQDGQYPTG